MTNRTRRIAALLLLFGLSHRLAAEQPVNYLDPPQGAFGDDWMIVQLNGEKVGYAHNVMTRDADIVSTRMLTYFRIQRADAPIEISTLQTTRETVAGQPLEFSSETKMATVELHTKGTINDGKVKMVSTQFGRETTQTVDYPEGAKMAWGIFRTGAEYGYKPGTTYDLKVFEPSINVYGAVNSKTVVGEHTSIEINGQRQDAIMVTTTLQLPSGSYDTLGYVDPNGRLLRAEVQMAAMPLVLIVADKVTALADFEAPEFFVNTLVKIDKPIDRDTAQRIRYTLELPDNGAHMPTIPTTAMQSVINQDRRQATIEVKRLDHKSLRTHSDATAHVPDELAPFLASSPTLNTTDEAVVAMAKEAADDESNPYLLADRLRVYVTETIRDKNLNVGFATASEVCRNREGDCSEHAVLLAALGRVEKIPSRVVVGLAYMPEFAGVKNVFGFHMWTQFYVAGQWVDFDAALRESDCNPARIALATSALDSSALGDIAFSIIDLITGLEISVDQVEHR